MNLKYLFEVEYLDGHFYFQNEKDVSQTDPKRSCFFDVNQDQVRIFTLNDGEKYFAVDLTDGHFEVNGVPFFMHDQGHGWTGFRLIFYRQHTHQFRPGVGEISHDVMYCIGWQIIDAKGRNHKRIMEVW